MCSLVTAAQAGLLSPIQFLLEQSRPGRLQRRILPRAGPSAPIGTNNTWNQVNSRGTLEHAGNLIQIGLLCTSPSSAVETSKEFDLPLWPSNAIPERRILATNPPYVHYGINPWKLNLGFKAITFRNA